MFLGLIADTLYLMLVLQDGLDDALVLVGQDGHLLLQLLEGCVDGLEIALQFALLDGDAQQICGVKFH